MKIESIRMQKLYQSTIDIYIGAFLLLLKENVYGFFYLIGGLGSYLVLRGICRMMQEKINMKRELLLGIIVLVSNLIYGIETFLPIHNRIIFYRAGIVTVILIQVLFLFCTLFKLNEVIKDRIQSRNVCSTSKAVFGFFLFANGVLLCNLFLHRRLLPYMIVVIIAAALLSIALFYVIYSEMPSMKEESQSFGTTSKDEIYRYLKKRVFWLEIILLVIYLGAGACINIRLVQPSRMEETKLTNNQLEIKTSLITLGVPQEVVRRMNAEEISQYSGITDYKEYNREDLLNGGRLSMTLGCAKLREGKVRIFAYYSWKKNPNFKGNDLITISIMNQDYQPVERTWKQKSYVVSKMPWESRKKAKQTHKIREYDGIETIQKKNQLLSKVSLFSFFDMKTGYLANTYSNTKEDQMDVNVIANYCHQKSPWNVPYQDSFEGGPKKGNAFFQGTWCPRNDFVFQTETYYTGFHDPEK